MRPLYRAQVAILDQFAPILKSSEVGAHKGLIDRRSGRTQEKRSLCCCSSDEEFSRCILALPTGSRKTVSLLPGTCCVLYTCETGLTEEPAPGHGGHHVVHPPAPVLRRRRGWSALALPGPHHHRSGHRQLRG